MSEDELVILTLRDLRRAEAAFAVVAVDSDEPGSEARRLRAERDGARLRHKDALRLSGRLVPHRAA